MTDIAIRVENLSKCFQIYGSPRDRLKQFFFPRVRRIFGKPEKNYFGEFWALKNVSLEIKKGETVGIIGRNGSGKSTMLQMICGTLSPSSGSIQTYGRVAALLELGAGFNPEFTGRENVYLNASVLGLRNEEIDARFDDILAFAEIGDFIEQPVKTYSSGMLVRLAFAVAINVDPEILIVDEALSVGDELFQRKCFSRIEAIRSKGATILFVSHSGGTIIELCDRAVLLDSGERLAVGSPKHIVARYQKMLYAPADKLKLIREQIRRAEDRSGSLENVATQIKNETENAGETHDEVLESYDPNLKPTSTLEYESLGVIIASPVILTVEGRQVNNLIRGKNYRYTYKVHFSTNAINVRFGMLIKTVSGVELGGAVSVGSINESVGFVDSGSTYQVEFRFRCSLNSGVYFLNAGVVGDVNGAETFLHRITDFDMFRVLHTPDNLATGIVDFECIPEFELL